MINCLNAIASFDQKNVKGTIIFHQCTNNSGSYVIFNLYNLVPNSENAIHIHEYGDLRNGCTSLVFTQMKKVLFILNIMIL
jgi:hypothetical protein